MIFTLLMILLMVICIRCHIVYDGMDSTSRESKESLQNARKEAREEHRKAKHTNLPHNIAIKDSVSRATSMAYVNLENAPIPMISVSLNMDKHRYLPRLLKSIDYPVDMICIQIGNSDPLIVQQIIEDVQFTRIANPKLNIQISTLDINPGSAKGFNFGLRNMMLSPSKPAWVLVVNNDIAFYPGVLNRIQQQVSQALVSNPSFGIGFTSLCCGGEWSAVIFTRRMVTEVGFFDENFYPAYYEDDDYGIRVHLSSYKAMRFPNTAMQHGTIDGSKDYHSGLFVNLYFNKGPLTEAEWAWRRAQDAGQVISKAYIEEKWKIKQPEMKEKAKKIDCKTIDGINEKCNVGVRTPFDYANMTIADWILNEEVVDNLIGIANPKPST
jgi:GT2 family glycosyltransferase